MFSGCPCIRPIFVNALSQKHLIVYKFCFVKTLIVIILMSSCLCFVLCRRDGGDGLQPGGDPGLSGKDEVRRDHSDLPAAGQEGLRGTNISPIHLFLVQ